MSVPRVPSDSSDSSDSDDSCDFPTFPENRDYRIYHHKCKHCKTKITYHERYRSYTFDLDLTDEEMKDWFDDPDVVHEDYLDSHRGYNRKSKCYGLICTKCGYCIECGQNVWELGKI